MALLVIFCFIFAAWALLLAIVNFVSLSPARVRTEFNRPAVSVLLPARDEEANIVGAIEQALTSREVDIEVIVLDDHSTDRTAEMVSEIAARDSRVHLFESAPLEKGWSGKVFACHQLSKHASHPWLLFVDCDVRFKPDAVRALVDEARAAPAKPGLVSGLPQELTGSWLEHLLIPMIHFIILAMLPIPAMRRSTSKSLTASVGQIILTRKEDYEEVGGHAAIKSTFHDGMRLAEKFREAGIATDLADLTHLATCRMYHNARETWNGLLKNAHEGMGAPKSIVPVTSILLLGQVLPWALLPFASGDALICLVTAAGYGPLIRAISAIRFKQSWIGVFLHPVGIVVLLAIQWIGLFRHLTGKRTEWKGRALD